MCLLIGWGVAGCRNERAASPTTTAAARATRVAWATRSAQMIDSPATPAPRAGVSAEDVTDRGPQKHDSVAVTVDADERSGVAPLTVRFTAGVDPESRRLRYRWDFGDHSPPVHQLRAQHTYQSPGQYTARFSVTGPGVDEWQEVTVEVTEETFDLDVEAAPDIGYAPLTVRFRAVVDEDAVGPLYFQWDFGDAERDVSGSTATHTYLQPGEYIATLAAENGRGQWAWRDVVIQVDSRDDAGAIDE